MPTAATTPMPIQTSFGMDASTASAPITSAPTSPIEPEFFFRAIGASPQFFVAPVNGRIQHSARFVFGVSRSAAIRPGAVSACLSRSPERCGVGPVLRLARRERPLGRHPSHGVGAIGDQRDLQPGADEPDTKQPPGAHAQRPRGPQGRHPRGSRYERDGGGGRLRRRVGRSRRGACITRLDTRPARTPVNASPTPSRACTHDSGPP